MVRGAGFAVCTTCFVAVYSVTISPYETRTMCMCERPILAVQLVVQQISCSSTNSWFAVEHLACSDVTMWSSECLLCLEHKIVMIVEFELQHARQHL